jgi:hypothetical protein
MANALEVFAACKSRASLWIVKLLRCTGWFNISVQIRGSQRLNCCYTDSWGSLSDVALPCKAGWSCANQGVSAAFCTDVMGLSPLLLVSSCTTRLGAFLFSLVFLVPSPRNCKWEDNIEIDGWYFSCEDGIELDNGWRMAGVTGEYGGDHSDIATGNIFTTWVSTTQRGPCTCADVDKTKTSHGPSRPSG